MADKNQPTQDAQLQREQMRHSVLQMASTRAAPGATDAQIIESAQRLLAFVTGESAAKKS